MSTDLKVEDVNVNLHKRVAATIAKGHSMTQGHTMRQSDLDGEQDLTLWLHSLEDVLPVRELLGDDIHTYDRHIQKWKVAYTRIESGISQNGKWHIPEWKVAYPKMESGIYRNGKWHIPKWKVAYTRVESGIYQSGKWHIPEWKVAYTRVAYPKFICDIYLCFPCMIDIP
jgi:hypothetical protein